MFDVLMNGFVCAVCVLFVVVGVFVLCLTVLYVSLLLVV